MSKSIEDKIGQMLVFGWDDDLSGSSSTVNTHALRLIQELRVGGVILMRRNVTTDSATKEMTGLLQKFAARARLSPLLIATDQEGGRVSRFSPPLFEAFPSASVLGFKNDVMRTTGTTSVMGQMLRNAGVNWALMPVLDVNNNPNNKVIGDRSYGDRPGLVSAMGCAAIDGMQRIAGIMACAKHFPGHGDTSIDSHLALPIIKKSLKCLNGTELPPFRDAIAAGVGSIMTSHILFPELDSHLPATLSSAILTGLLRNTLGFKGLIVTDCLQMAGVAAKWGSAEAAVLAAIAGADMLLACHSLSVQLEIRQALIMAANTGRLSESRIDEANQRIAIAKDRWVSRPRRD